MTAKTWQPRTPAEKKLAAWAVAQVEQVVEHVSKAMCEAEGNLEGDPTPWEERPLMDQCRLKLMALAAIEALGKWKRKAMKGGPQ